MFDLGSPSLAEALLERDPPDRRESLFSRNLAESLLAGAIAGEPAEPSWTSRPRANPIQLRMFGDLPLVVRPEKRPWPKTIAPARKKSKATVVPKRARAAYLHTDGTHAERSYSEIARALGVSVERVRQLEANALRKCRIECEKRGITPDVFLRTWRGGL